MQKLILLSGLGGSGKTTCANLLYERLTSVAVLDADVLFCIKPFEVGEKLSRIKVQNSIHCLRTFLEEGYEYVVCCGLVWSQAELNEVVTAFAHRECALFLFWLKTGTEERHRRVVTRGRDTADTKEWLEEIEKKIADPTPFALQRGVYEEILTDGKTPEDVASEIMRKLQ